MTSSAKQTTPRNKPKGVDLTLPPMPPPDICVLHEDDHLIAVCKPSGLLVHRTKESTDQVVLLQETAAIVGHHLYPAHRIDRGASGVVFFGKRSEDARWLQASLQSSTAHKEYVVLVRGEAPERGESDRPLKDDDGVRRECRTTFVRERLFPYCSLLRVQIETGRRHQIRRHLAHLAHQVIGDTTYGKGRLNALYREKYGLHRLFLHAHTLELDHAPRGDRLRVVAPLRPELERTLAQLDAEAAAS